MAYTPPTGDAIVFDPFGGGAYTPPGGGSILFDPASLASPGVSAAIVEAADTVAATLLARIVASVAIVEADDTVAATLAANLPRNVAASITEAPDTLSAALLARIKASAAIAEANDTLSAALLTRSVIRAAITEANDTLAATAKIAAKINAAITEQPDVCRAASVPSGMARISSGTDPYMNWLARDNASRCILVEFDYQFESGGLPATGTLYLSNKVFFDDTASPQIAYTDCINSVPTFQRNLSGDRLGQYSSSIGTLEIDNADGQADFFFDLAIDGSDVRFYLGDIGWPRSEFELIFSAVASLAAAPSFDRVSITLKDTGLLLNQSIGGTTLVGGTGPNANQARPVNFGYVHNLQALVLDSAFLIYVHSDTGTGTIATDVRDRGVSVSYTENGDGTFTLLASPDGAITVDVVASPDGGDSPTTDARAISDAMYELVGVRSGLAVMGRYEGAGPTFATHDDDDYLVGISLPEARNVIDLLGDIVDSGNCFWAVLRTGEFTFGRLRPNDIQGLVDSSGSPSLPVTAIVEDDIDNGSFRLDHSAPLYYQYQAYMSQNWFVQTDLASSLTPDEQAVYTRKGIYLLQAPGVGSTYNDAPELYNKSLTVSPVIDTLLSGGFDELDLPFLETWMDTRRDMFLPWIETVSVTVGIDFYELELGDVVSLTMARFGEDGGTLFQVIGINIKLSQAKIDLRLVRRRLLAPPPDNWFRITQSIDAEPFPSQLGPPFIPGDPTISPPTIFPVPGYPIGLGGSGGLAPNFRPVVIGAGGRVFRIPTPPTDGFIVMYHAGGNTIDDGEGGTTLQPGGFFGPNQINGNAVSGSLLFFPGATMPTIDGVAGQLAVIDTDGKYEIAGTCDGTGWFPGWPICIPAYSWEMSAVTPVDLVSIVGSPTNPGIEWTAVNSFGTLGAAGNDQMIYAHKFWAAGVQYIAYMVRPDAVPANGQSRFVGVTTNSDLRASYGGYAPASPILNFPGAISFASSGLTAGNKYRNVITSEGLNNGAFISGYPITTPYDGMTVASAIGAATTTVTETAPANDAFASATQLTVDNAVNVSVGGYSNQLCTTEVSEPGGLTNTSWFWLRTNATGFFNCDTLGSVRQDDADNVHPLDTVINIYGGATGLATLTLLKTNDDGTTDVTSAIGPLGSYGVGSFSPQAGSLYSIQVGTKSGQYGKINFRYSVNVAMAPPPPVITSGGTLATGVHGVAITPYTITGTNSPFSFFVIGLPAGLSVNASTGVVSGTPTSAGSGTVTVGANNNGGSGFKTLVSYTFT